MRTRRRKYNEKRIIKYNIYIACRNVDILLRSVITVASTDYYCLAIGVIVQNKFIFYGPDSFLPEKKRFNKRKTLKCRKERTNKIT